MVKLQDGSKVEISTFGNIPAKTLAVLGSLGVYYDWYLSEPFGRCACSGGSGSADCLSGFTAEG